MIKSYPGLVNCAVNVCFQPNLLMFCFFNSSLTFNTLCKTCSRRNLKYFSYFSRKQDLTFHANCYETICMKYQSQFSGKKKSIVVRCFSGNFRKGFGVRDSGWRGSDPTVGWHLGFDSMLFVLCVSTPYHQEVRCIIFCRILRSLLHQFLREIV